MIWQIISYQNKDYVRDHRSIGLFWEWCFCEEFGSECFGLFLFYFCLVRGEKVTHKILVGNQTEGTTSSRGFLSFLVYLWQFCIVQILSGPKTLLDVSFVFFRSLIGNFLSFFCFLPLFDWEFFFFLFFLFAEGKDWHSHPGSRFMVAWGFGSKGL